MVSIRGSHENGDDVPLKKLDSSSSQDSTATDEEPLRKSTRIREKTEQKVSPGGGGHDSDEENRRCATGIPPAPSHYTASAATTSAGSSKIPQPTLRRRAASVHKKKPEPEVVTLLDSTDEEEDSKKVLKTPEIKKSDSTEKGNEDEEGKASVVDEQPKTRRTRATTPARGTASAKKSKISEHFSASPPPQEENTSDEKEKDVEEEKSARGRRSRATTPAKTPAKSKVPMLVLEDIEVEPFVSEKSSTRSTRASSRSREGVSKEDQQPKTPVRRRMQQPAILHIEDIDIEEEDRKKKEEEVSVKTPRATRASSRAREQASPARSTRATTPARKEAASPMRLTRAMRKAGMTTPGQDDSEEPAKFELAPEEPVERDNECQIEYGEKEQVEKTAEDVVELQKTEIATAEKTKQQDTPAEEVVEEAPAAEVFVDNTAASESVMGPIKSQEPYVEQQPPAAPEVSALVLPEEGPSTARRRGFDKLADNLIRQLYTPKRTPAKPSSLPSVLKDTSTPIPGQGNSSFMDWEECPTPQSVHTESPQPSAFELDLGSVDFEDKDLFAGDPPSKEASYDSGDEAADSVLKEFKEKKRLSGESSSSKDTSVEVDPEENIRALARELDVSNSSSTIEIDDEAEDYPKEVFDTSLNMEGLLQEREEETDDTQVETGEEASEKAESVADDASSVDDNSLVIDENSKDSEAGYISIEEAEKVPESAPEVIVTVETEVSKDLIVEEVVIEEVTEVAEKNIEVFEKESEAKEAAEETSSKSPAPRATKTLKSDDDLSNFLDQFQDSPASASVPDDPETRKLKKGKSVVSVATRKEPVPEAPKEDSVEEPKEPVESAVQSTVATEVAMESSVAFVETNLIEVRKTESDTSFATAVEASESVEMEGEKKKKKKKRQSAATSTSSEFTVSTEEISADVQETECAISVSEVVEQDEEPRKKKKKRQSIAPSVEVATEVVSKVPEEPLLVPVTTAAESSESVEKEGEKKKKKKKRQSLANTQIFLGDEEEETKTTVAPELPATEAMEVEPEVVSSDLVEPVTEEAEATPPKDKKKKNKKKKRQSVGEEEEKEVVAEVVVEEEKKDEVAEVPAEETSGVEKKKKKRKKSLAVDSSDEVQEEVKKVKIDDEVLEAAVEIEEEQVKEKKNKKKKQKKAAAEQTEQVEETVVPEIVVEQENVEEVAEAEAKKSKKKKKAKKMVVAPEEEVEVEVEAATGVVNYPTLSFKKLFNEPELCSSKISAALSALYTWSCKQERHDDLPDTFLNNDDETVYQFVTHKGKQIKKDFRKFKSLLDEPIACPLLEDEEKEAEDEEFDQDLEDEEAMDVDDEAFAGDEEDEDEVDLFNLRGEDLKDLERELAAMDNEKDEDDDAGSSSDKENGDEKKPKKQQQKKKFPKSVVDDKFFNLAEMDAFCDDQEKQNDDEGILATVDDSWGGPADYHYEDFFGKLDDVVGEDTSAHKKTKKRKADDSDCNLRKKKKSVRFAMDEEEKQEHEEEMEEENGEPDADEPVLLGKAAKEEKVESKLKADIRKLKESIRKLEQENLEPRSWELSGEVTAQQRGENALLDTHVQFDNTSKRAPEVTEDFTQKLEALIKQRIKDQAFDDVVRIKKVDEKVDVYRNDAIEEMENMKKSLSEVYEKEYQKAAGQVEAVSAENEQHKAIQAKVDRLFQLIDAMSHFEYTPPQVRPEIRVVSNMPALRVEEVGMMASTDAQLLAPEEMKKRQKGDLKADEERTSTDKLRQRRKKKTKQRAMVLTLGTDKALAGQIEKKIKKKTKKAGGADKAEESMKSTNFFSKLQDTVQKELKQKTTKKTKKVKSEKASAGGAKFKL